MRIPSSYLLAGCLPLIGIPMAIAQPVLPAGEGKRIFDVRNYGAAGDGTTLNTAAIQKAIDALATSGGGTLWIPRGQFLSGAIILKPSVNLHLDQGAVLKGSTNIEDYPVRNTRIEGHFQVWIPALINASNADHLRITGAGTVQGGGKPFWDEFWKRRGADKTTKNLDVRRPRNIFIEDSTDVEVSGISLRDSGFWNLHLFRCQDVLVDKVDIRTPSHAPSTDGIDVDSCRNVTVRGSYLSVDDDNIVLKGNKGTSALDDKTIGPDEHIRISNCTFGLGNAALTLGSEATLVRDVIMENCTLTGTEKNCILKLKLRPDTEQHYENIMVQNITVNNPEAQLISIQGWTQYFDLQGRPAPSQLVTNVTLSNITGTLHDFGQVAGPAKSSVSGLTFKDINVTLKNSEVVIKNVKDLKLSNVKINGVKYTGDQPIADDPFAWPPITAQTKPWAYNWWMGSAVDKTNLTQELERYAAAGLGGIHIIPIYGAKGFEDKYIDYLSPKWMEMMGWAVSEARRLGMGVDMTTGSGWCFGGPQVKDQDANASVVVKTYEVKAGEKLTQKFNRKSTQALVAFGPEGKVIELTDKISADGDVSFSAPNGTWTFYAISQKPSGQKVKRAGPGGEGWMLNLIYAPAMDDYLKPFTAAFADYTGPKPRAQYHDSYEYRSDWSPDFFAQFEKRRGYRLQTELPALFSKEDNDHAARVKCDYRQTVSEIMAEESLPKWVNWSHEHGFLTRNQAHGSPGNWLDLYAAADIPETEMFHTDRNKLISKFASSAAHVTGKPLVSAETGTWLEEHFTEKLSDVKYLMDDLFLSGINHLFYHGCCYSPNEAGWPGWHFYASLEMNPRNSIWRDAPALNAYAARVQSVLQSGQPDNDILLYWNTGDFWMQPGDKLLPQLTVHERNWFESQPIGKIAKELWDKGYAFDYVSDAQLKTAKVADGKIKMPGGDYKVIVVPECKFIPLETFKQLLTLVKKGAMVVFVRNLTSVPNFPPDISGLNQFEKKRLEKMNLFSKIELKQVAKGAYKANVGSGQIVETMSLEFWPLKQFTSFKPEQMTEQTGLSFVRRSFEAGWNYFIANRTKTNFDGWITLSRDAKSIVILDPMTVNSGAAATRQSAANQIEVHLQLAAGESVMLRAFADKKVEGPAWTYWQPQTPDAKPQTLTGPWNVKFLLGGPTLPADFQTAKLASWTTFPDTNTQAFAGTAKYETTFDAPQERRSATRSDSATKDALRLTEPRSSYSLDLGDVRQSARVRVNGKDYGTLLTPPFRVVLDNLKTTGNTLEVEVTSVAANRIRDLDRRGVKWKTFRDINIVSLDYKPFDASGWPLTDCGLLGPVTLVPVVSGK